MIVINFLKTQVIRKTYIFIFFLILGCVPVNAQRVGDNLQDWEEGFLDIHYINTGCGDCTFFIFPDGTTMMVDAGENSYMSKRHVPPKPNNRKTAGDWIVKYLKDILPEKNRQLDYFLLTHYHGDHIGGTFSKLDKSGKYFQTGAITVIKNIPTIKLVDRDFPNYNMNVDIKEKALSNFINFLNFSKNAFIHERFEPSSNNQFNLMHGGNRDSLDFEIRNIYSNGWLWTGQGNQCRYLFPHKDSILPHDCIQENTLSCVIRLKYGRFSYYTGGDVTGYPKPGRSKFHDVETHIAPIVGKVEVCCINHHGYNNATNETFLKHLQPRIFIIEASDALHPNHSTLERIVSKHVYSGKRDVFTTNLHPAAEVVIGENCELMKSTQGHIVIRVSAGGNEYFIYILDDNNRKHVIKKIYGPYFCGKN